MHLSLYIKQRGNDMWGWGPSGKKCPMTLFLPMGSRIIRSRLVYCSGQLSLAELICCWRHDLCHCFLLHHELVIWRKCSILGYLKEHPKWKKAFDPEHPEIDKRWFSRVDWYYFYKIPRKEFQGTCQSQEAIRCLCTVLLWVTL